MMVKRSSGFVLYYAVEQCVNDRPVMIPGCRGACRGKLFPGHDLARVQYISGIKSKFDSADQVYLCSIKK